MESVNPTGLEIHERTISRAHLNHLLGDLETRGGANGVSIYARAGRFQEALGMIADRNIRAAEELTRLAPRVQKSATGAAAFWSEDTSLAVLPPFPLARDDLVAGWHVAPLRLLLAREYVVGVVLLRLGRFSVGVFRSETLLASKTDTRYVKGRHSAGGTSQKRFERIRDKQVQELFQKTCSVVEEQFAPFEDQLDYIFFGGERFTLNGFLKRCGYLQSLSPKILPRMLNVRKPKRTALEVVIETIWESRVLSIR